MGMLDIWRTGLGRDVGRASRNRILLWSTIAGLIFGAVSLGAPLEGALRSNRNKLHKHNASGDIVVVAIDDRSLRELGTWPWPRRYHAKLADTLRRTGARRIFYNIDFTLATNPRDDEALATALSQVEVTLPVQVFLDPVSQKATDVLPHSLFTTRAQLASNNFEYDFRGAVWNLPYTGKLSQTKYSSLASRIARVEGPAGKHFSIDYSLDLNSLPSVSATDVLKSSAEAKIVIGKDVIIGVTSRQLGDLYGAANHDRLPGVYIHAFGAETLKSGTPIDISWLVPFALALALAVWLIGRINPLLFLLGAGASGTLLLTVPIALEAHLIFVDIVPTFFLLLVISLSLSWSSFRQSYRRRGMVNTVSGFKNLNALYQDESGRRQVLIAARVQNYARIASALPAGGEAVLVAQIASRLTLGTTGSTLYQGDEGVFTWFAVQDTTSAVGEHLEALHGFFRSPLKVEADQVDVSISFGVDAELDRPLSNRLGAALVAADAAAAEGSKWKVHDPAQREDAAWRLSLLGQLDQAIDNGDFWVAYQPKLDMATGLVSGAEALARWTHPEKGSISPADFILAAEQNDRVEKLTRFVLDDGIRVAAAVNARGAPFGIAVNISPRIVGTPELIPLVIGLLGKHGLAPGLLTLEITETAAIGGAPGAIETLDVLRALGVGISIDDYGTGLSTLEYLKKIPATEIKIDRSFVSAVTRSPSDRLMVHSTIALAHSLGQKVVAEGIEDRETLDALAAMGCDFGQGYHLWRPMPVETLVSMLDRERSAPKPAFD